MSTMNVATTKMNEALLSKNDLTLCAVSGGIDSMYLLCRLRELGYPAAAAHFNHRLRGAESDRDEAFVADFCRENGIAFRVGCADVAAYAEKNRLGTEQAARLLRYEFLERAADDLGAARIATAHTADDNAETVLLHLARGAGLRGLTGIPPVRGRIVRPMLDVTRAEAEAYLEARGIGHVEDSTNASDDYARNRVRHGAVPALQSVNPAFSRAVGRTAELLRADESFLSALAEELLRANVQENTVDAAALTTAALPVAARAVRRLCGAELSAEHVRAVLKTARDGGAVDIPGLRVEKQGRLLVFGAVKPGILPERALNPERELLLPEAGLAVRCRRMEECPDVHSAFNTFFFQCENICGNMTVAARREGDSLRLAGRGCTKPLRRLLSEAGIPAQRRDLIPVLRDEAGILAVYGIGTAERVVARPGDKKILKIQIVREKPDGEL